MRNSINCLFARWGRQHSAGAPARSNRMYVHIHSGSRQLLHALLYPDASDRRNAGPERRIATERRPQHPCSRARSASYPAHKNPAFLRYA
jgi:hypothetical protein